MLKVAIAAEMPMVTARQWVVFWHHLFRIEKYGERLNNYGPTSSPPNSKNKSFRFRRTEIAWDGC